MRIIDHDFVLSRTPTVDSTGYLVENASTGGLLSYSLVRQTLRNLHLWYMMKDLSNLGFPTGNDVMEKLHNEELPESYPYVRGFKEVAEAHNRHYMIVFRPSSWPVSWQSVSKQLHPDCIEFIDLSFLRDEFTREPFRATSMGCHHHRIGEFLAEYVQKGPMTARVPGGTGRVYVFAGWRHNGSRKGLCLDYA
jgi:hypothetical protein